MGADSSLTCTKQGRSPWLDSCLPCFQMQVRASYDAKPFRKTMMQTGGRLCTPAPQTSPLSVISLLHAWCCCATAHCWVAEAELLSAFMTRCRATCAQLLLLRVRLV